MADKRRKRKTNATSCFEDSSSSSSKEDFHAVTINDPVAAAAAMPRRRSEANSSSGSSSWMTKVTAAMSHRIFSSKKLGSSRSTQVMPLAGAVTGSTNSSHEPKHQGSSLSSSAAVATILLGESDTGSISAQRPPTLRQVSSENSLARRTTDTEAAAETAIQSSTPVERVDFCPSVVCDVAPDDEEEDEGPESKKTKKKQSAIQSIHVKGSQQQQQHRNTNSISSVMVIEKIVPRGRHENSDDDDDDFEDRSSQRQRYKSKSKSKSNPVGPAAFSSPRLTVLDRESKQQREATCSDPTPVIQDTAPILKDFFSRSASTGQGIRVQQLESRRESLYKSSKQRQEHLRKRIEQESHASEAQLRKFRAEQLQRLNQQRRVHLRQGATSAHKDLASRLESDTRRFATERERWENEFESEIQILNRAFRKASAKPLGTTRGADGAIRPTTVAGLAVPQALSRIRRDASNYEKRLKTAEPRASSQRREWDFSGSAMKSRQRGSLESGKCDIFCLENAKEDDDDGEVFEVLNTSEDMDEGRKPIASEIAKLTIDKLLDERQSLLQRIAQLEKLVGDQQIAAASTKAAATELQ